MRRVRDVEPTRLTLADAAGQATTAILARPARAALTVLGTLLGVAAFVAVLGLTSTAASQISTRFTALAATEVTLEDTSPSVNDAAFPGNAEARLQRLNGVKSAGVHWPASPEGEQGQAQVSTRPQSSREKHGVPLSVVGASPGYLDAVHARLGSGRVFDAFHQRTKQPVALVGRAAAQQLSLAPVSRQPSIFVGNTPLTVIGVIDDVDRHAENLLSVIVPSDTARRLWGPPTEDTRVKALIDTKVGAAALIGRQAPLALRPHDPDRFKVTVPPNPQQLKTQVSNDLAMLFLGLAGVSLIIGAVGIANTTLVSVLERTAEIGLRRSLGARGRHIAAQFLAESGLLGLLGGLVGASIGVAAVVATAFARAWTPVVEPWTVLPAPIMGAVVGVLAGVYPAWRASRIEPVDALRR